MQVLGIEVGVGMNASGFSDGLDQVRAKLNSFGNDLAGKLFGSNVYSAIAKVGKFIYSATQAAIADVKEIKIGKVKTGLDAAEFQKLRNELEASGSSADAFAVVLGRIADSMVDVKNGGEVGAQAAKDFANLGVSIDDLKAKSRQQVFAQIKTDLQGAAAQAKLTEDQLSSLKAVGGRGAIDLVPYIARGDNANDLAGIHSEKTMKELEAAKKSSDEISSVWKEIDEEASIWWLAIRKGVLQATQFDFDVKQSDEDKALDAHFAKIQAKLNAAKQEKAHLKADDQADENQKQRNREEIAQLEAEQKVFLEKAKTKKQRLDDIKKEMEEIRKTKLGLTSEDSDVKRARLNTRLAELEAERSSESEKTPVAKNLTHVNDLQRIGAAIASPIDMNPMRDTARHTGRISAQIDAWQRRAQRVPARP